MILYFQNLFIISWFEILVLNLQHRSTARCSRGLSIWNHQIVWAQNRRQFVLLIIWLLFVQTQRHFHEFIGACSTAALWFIGANQVLGFYSLFLSLQKIWFPGWSFFGWAWIRFDFYMALSSFLEMGAGRWLGALALAGCLWASDWLCSGKHVLDFD